MPDVEDLTKVPLPSNELRGAGASLLLAIVDWFSWSHRKVESLDFYEGQRGRRRISVDCTPIDILWRDEHVQISTKPEASVAVPLTLMGKSTLRSLDVRDASGAALPVLGTDSNGILAACALLNLLEIAKVENADAHWPRIVRTAMGDPAAARAEADALCDELDLPLFVRQQFHDLASSFILFALLPPGSAGIRTVIKYSYHWDVETPGPAASFDLQVRSWMKTLAAGLGLASLSVDVDLYSADSSRSYHLECTAPGGISCSEVRLPKDLSGSEPLDLTIGPVGHAKGSYGYLHRGVDAPARVSFVMEPGGALSRAALFSGLTVVFLVFVILTPAATDAFIKDPGSAQSLLLFLPAVLLALNTKGSENVFVSRVLRPSRVVSAVLSGFYAVSGGLLVAQASQDVVTGWWRIGLFIALIALLLTGGGLYRLNVRRKV